jgi:putative endonuclease
MPDTKKPAIYIISNKSYGTLYTGVTSDLVKRVYEHKHNILNGFAGRYNCQMLIYYELYDTMENAILREKQIKGGSRQGKLDLVKGFNPDWKDLYLDIL